MSTTQTKQKPPTIKSISSGLQQARDDVHDIIETVDDACTLMIHLSEKIAVWTHPQHKMAVTTRRSLERSCAELVRNANALIRLSRATAKRAKAVATGVQSIHTLK